MNCRHCQQWNPEEEERCRLCGGKMRPSAKDTPEWSLHAVSGNLAAAPAPARYARHENAAAEPPPQRPLFPDRPTSNVIPFERLPGGRAWLRPEPPVMPSPPKAPPAGTISAPKPKPPAQPKPPMASRKAGMQAELDFLPPAPVAPRTLKTKVEASIFCDAPVATLTHRFFAGAVDFSLILSQYALCVAAYCFMGGALPVNRLGFLTFAAAFLVLAAFYGLVWALGNTETAGMRCARLRLTNFDGFPPEPGPRLWRYFGTCLSFATCGFGLLWALADEEELTWQDHISKTFPTFHRVETNFCKAR